MRTPARASAWEGACRDRSILCVRKVNEPLAPMRGFDVIMNVLQGKPSSLTGQMYPTATLSDADSVAARVVRSCADVDAHVAAASNDTSVTQEKAKRATHSVQECAAALADLDVASQEVRELLAAKQDTNLSVSNQLTSAGALCGGLHAHATLRETDHYRQLREAQRKLHQVARAKTRQMVMNNCQGLTLSDRHDQPLHIRASRLANAVGGAADDDDQVPTGIWVLLVVILVLFLLVVALLIALQVSKGRPTASPA